MLERYPDIKHEVSHIFVEALVERPATPPTRLIYPLTSPRDGPHDGGVHIPTLFKAKR